MRDDRSVFDFLTGDYTFVNSRLAKLYGISGVNGDEFQRVRVGVGRPDSTDPEVVAAYVLARFAEPDSEVRELIATMARDNPRWGSERIRGELLKLGLVVSKRSIQRYRRRGPASPSSQTWRTFLANHAHHLWAADLLTVCKHSRSRRCTCSCSSPTVGGNWSTST